MSSVERPPGAISEGRKLEGIRGGIQETRCWARGSTKGEPSPTTLRVIEVIHATPKGTNATKSRVLAMASTGDCSENQQPVKKMKSQSEPIAFDDEDLEGTIQPHDDALMITARISGFLVGDGRPGKRSRCNVSGPIQRAWIKGSGLDKI